MSSADPVLLGFALGLAFAGYAIGAMAKIMPLPGSRAAGTEMMEDSFIAFAFISTISLVIIAANPAAALLYGGRSTNAVYDGFYHYVNEATSGPFLILSVVMGVLFAVRLANTIWGIPLPGSQPFLPLALILQRQMEPWIGLLRATYTLNDCPRICSPSSSRQNVRSGRVWLHVLRSPEEAYPSGRRCDDLLATGLLLWIDTCVNICLHVWPSSIVS